MSEYKHEIGSRVEHYINKRKGTVTNQCIGINWCYVLFDGDEAITMVHNHSLEKIKEKTMVEKDDHVEHKSTKRKGFVTGAYNQTYVYVRFDFDIGSTLCHVQNLKKLTEKEKDMNDTGGFKKGQTVKIVGVSGEGVVLADSNGVTTRVRWNSGGVESNPLTSNLRLVREAPKLQVAISLLEAERDWLIAEENKLQARRLDIEGAIKLIKRAE